MTISSWWCAVIGCSWRCVYVLNMLCLWLRVGDDAFVTLLLDISDSVFKCVLINVRLWPCTSQCVFVIMTKCWWLSSRRCVCDCVFTNVTLLLWRCTAMMLFWLWACMWSREQILSTCLLKKPRSRSVRTSISNSSWAEKWRGQRQDSHENTWISTPIYSFHCFRYYTKLHVLLFDEEKKKERLKFTRSIKAEINCSARCNHVH